MKKYKNYIDDMVEVFGYDYVIGYCLCSEYDLRGKANRETDPDKKDMYFRSARNYGNKAGQLSKERVEFGL